MNIPYEPAVKAVKKAAQTAKSKALALRDYMTKPPPPKPTKRITPERVSSSPQETESYAEFEQFPEAPEPEPAFEAEEERQDDVSEMLEAFKTLGSADNPIFWEPSCFSEDHDYEHNAEYLQELFNERLDVDNDILKPLYNMGHTNAALAILPIIHHPCNALMLMLEAYCHLDFDGRLHTGLNALVFYRRHSYQLDPLLTQTEVDFFEGMCNFLLCFLRNAGYRVTHTASQQ